MKNIKEISTIVFRRANVPVFALVIVFILGFLFALNGRYKIARANSTPVWLDSWTGTIHHLAGRLVGEIDHVRLYNSQK